jgi:CDP-diacylglycerol--serine O-phosphatidyltransferase
MNTRLLRIKQWYRHIPTALTLGNSLCGFGAILHALTAYRPAADETVPQLLAFSAWLIVGAMVFDMLDGWTARVLKADSAHGMEMDSLADMVTFGVAPAVIVAVLAHTTAPVVGGEWLSYRWVWVLCAVYLGCTALRLAIYNVKAASGAKSSRFSGLPSPGAAAAVVSLVILYSRNETAFGTLILAEILPIYAGIIGILMVSNVPYAHIGQWLGSRRRNKRKVLALIAFCAVFAWDPRLVAAVGANLYVLSGPVNALIRRATTPAGEREADIAAA